MKGSESKILGFVLLGIGGYVWLKNRNKNDETTNSEASTARADVIRWMNNDDAAAYQAMTDSEIVMVWKFLQFERSGDTVNADKMLPIIKQIARKYNIAI